MSGARRRRAGVTASLAVLAVLAGCAGRGPGPAPVPLPATADTGVAVIDGPTLIGFFPRPTTATAGDSAWSRRLADFQAGLAHVREAFERAGVRVYEQYVDTVVVREAEGGMQIYVPPPAQGGIGYYLAAPGRAPEILHGVRSETDIRAAAVRYFHGRGASRQALR